MDIDMLYLKECLARLLRTPSPTGYPREVMAVVEGILRELGIEASSPRKGGLLVRLPGYGRPLLAAAHLDTLGAMVREIHSDGTLSFVRVGTYMTQSVEGENCTILTRKGPRFSGTIFTTEPSVHIYDEPAKLERKLANYRVLLDERVSKAEETQALGVQAGDFIALDPRTVFLPNGFVKSRHLDDKAGAACLLAVLQALKRGPAHRAVSFYFTIYEEVGHGAAAGIPADVEEILSVDIGLVGQGQTSAETAVTICAKDAVSPYDYELTETLIRTAEAYHIPYRLDVFPHYGSDANAALNAGHDLRAGLIGPGVFATHFYERTHEEGLLATARLLSALLLEGESSSAA
ncbi:MAG: M42 family metallopeptidase [bacterium]